MKYSIKSLKSFAVNFRGLFILLIVSQLTCVLLLFFSFGIYQNYINETQKELNGESDGITGYQNFEVSEEKTPYPEDLKISPDDLDGFYYKVGEIIGSEKINAIYMGLENFEFILNYENGIVDFDTEMFDNIINKDNNVDPDITWDYGRYFEGTEYIDGDNVCIAPSSCCEEFAHEDENESETQSYERNEYGEWVEVETEEHECPYSAYKKGDEWYVNIEGKEYRVIGFCNNYGSYYIPYKNMPGNIYLNEFPGIQLKKNLTNTEFEQLAELYDEYFPDIEKSYYQLNLVDDEEIYYYNTNMWICVIVAVASSINLCLMINYILTRRRKTMAIYRICGCSALKVRRIYITELMLILNAVFALCFALWKLLLLPYLGGIFIYMMNAFSAKVYALIYLCYILIAYVSLNIVIIGYIRKQPINLLHKRGG